MTLTVKILGMCVFFGTIGFSIKLVCADLSPLHVVNKRSNRDVKKCQKCTQCTYGSCIPDTMFFTHILLNCSIRLYFKRFSSEKSRLFGIFRLDVITSHGTQFMLLHACIIFKRLIKLHNYLFVLYLCRGDQEV